MKYIVVLGDGMADEPLAVLGGKTPLEAANIPVMDALAGMGEMGMVQNVPEGMVIIAPMLSVGTSPGKTVFIAFLTGLIEVVGTVIGYFAVSTLDSILPFALAFAAGTMLYVISDEIIPDTHADGAENGATYALLSGFCLILIFDWIL